MKNKAKPRWRYICDGWFALANKKDFINTSSSLYGETISWFNGDYKARKEVESPEDYKDCDPDCIGYNAHIEYNIFTSLHEAIGFIEKDKDRRYITHHRGYYGIVE